MLRLAADENFDADIARGLLRRLPDLDIVRVRDADLSGADDPPVIECAAREGRIALTHDVSTVVSSPSTGCLLAAPCQASSRRLRQTLVRRSARRFKALCFSPRAAPMSGDERSSALGTKQFATRIATHILAKSLPNPLCIPLRRHVTSTDSNTADARGFASSRHLQPLGKALA
jgi:hypothetical protein